MCTSSRKTEHVAPLSIASDRGAVGHRYADVCHSAEALVSNLGYIGVRGTVFQHKDGIGG